MNMLSIARLTTARIAIALLLCAQCAHAEVGEVRVAQQFGVAYLPLMVIKKLALIEKHAEKSGAGALKVSWTTFSAAPT